MKFRFSQLFPTRRIPRSAGWGALVAGLVLILGLTGAAAGADFSAWSFRQELNVPAAGLVKLDLPPQTLSAAQPGLEDLRVADPAGSEVPYAIERPRPASASTRTAKSFQVTLGPQAAVITIETGVSEPIQGVSLNTPAGSFLKSVQVEGSADRQAWQTLASGQPIFRRGGASQLGVALPTGAWAFLRVTVDDQRSEPIPFTGALVTTGAGQTPPSAPVALSMGERVENPGQTRLALDLGAANLDLAVLRFETPDPLFTRKVTVLVRQVSESAIREQILAEGVIYRVAVNGQPASARLGLPIERQVRARQMVVLIQNDDSPPLQITAVTATRRPVYAVFHARQTGVFSLFADNARASQPRYDLAGLGADWQTVPVSPLRPSALVANPAFRSPEAVPEVRDGGAPVDVTGWSCRKPLRPERPGVEQVELDPEVMAHAQPGFRDLRLVRDGKQIPYVLEHTSITRPLEPQVTLANDPKKPRETRWQLKLPLARLPVERLVCEAATPLFRREVRLYEMARDDREERYERPLGQASWVQTPERKSKQFALSLSSRPETDSLFLETDNGDNPAVELTGFRVYYPVTRVLFKTTATAPVFLYYGSREANPPSYDLDLVAGQLLAADKTAVTLGAEERLKKAGWQEGTEGGKGGVLFWGALALVVAVLLFLITRLLPHKATEP
jgi:hypothetical protein